jgi:hypothetical protein
MVAVGMVVLPWVLHITVHAAFPIVQSYHLLHLLLVLRVVGFPCSD